MIKCVYIYQIKPLVSISYRYYIGKQSNENYKAVPRNESSNLGYVEIQLDCV